MEMVEPPVQGRHVYLRPIRQADYETIRMHETAGERQILYRSRGQTPSPEQHVASLWTNVLAQFMVVAKLDAAPLGVVSAYNPDHRNGTTWIAAITFSSHAGTGWPLEGIQLFIDYIFRAFPMRKIYGEVFSPNATRFVFSSRLFREEGRLRAHEYYDGEYHDSLIYALYRQDWVDYRAGTSSSQRLNNFLDERLHLDRDPEDSDASPSENRS